MCVFFDERKMKNKCSALIVCECEGCKFKKTVDELNEARLQAALMLQKKGLKSVIVKDGNGKEIVTTVKVDEENESKLQEENHTAQ